MITYDALTSPPGVESKSFWAASENSLWWPECSINSTAFKGRGDLQIMQSLPQDLLIYYTANYIRLLYRFYTYLLRSKLDVNGSDPTKTALRQSQIVPKAVCLPWLQWSQILVDGWLADHQHCKRMDMIWVQEHCTDKSCPQVAAKSTRFIKASGKWHDSRVFKLRIEVCTIGICHCRFRIFWTLRRTRPDLHNVKSCKEIKSSLKIFTLSTRLAGIYAVHIYILCTYDYHIICFHHPGFAIYFLWITSTNSQALAPHLQEVADHQASAKGPGVGDGWVNRRPVSGIPWYL